MRRHVLGEVLEAMCELDKAMEVAMEGEVFAPGNLKSLRGAAQRFIVAYGALEIDAMTFALDPELQERNYTENLLATTRPYDVTADLFDQN